jgi:prepilin-type N-terminal cleavage/methylation domain-containing protein
MSQFRGNESGYTLTELLVAMTVGLIVLLAAFTLTDHATSLSNEIADRQDAVQRGRQAMENLTRQLRSQVCLGETTEPITEGTPTRIKFYADLGDGSTNIEQRLIEYDAVNQRITEKVYPGVGTYPDLSFAPESSPARTRRLLDKADEVKVGGVDQPVFRFFAFRVGGAPGDLQQLPTPLSSSDASRVVMVKIQFVALPARTVPKDRDATTFYNDVYVRIADPTRPTEGPRCL